MRAVIVLLATAVAFAYGSPHPNLKYIMTELHCLNQKTLNTEFDSVFVKDLKKNQTDSCEAEFFCQADRVLSGVELFKELDTCHVDKLLRNLRQYNKGVNCCVPTKGDEILLHSFLDNLTKCAKKVFGRQNLRPNPNPNPNPNPRPNQMNSTQHCI